MIVQKFGGTSVADAARIRVVARIVGAHLDRRPVVVVSALARITDLLVSAIGAAGAGRRESLEPVLAEIERRHRWAVSGLFDSGRRRHDLALALDERFDELRQLLRAIRVLGEATPRAADTLLAFGEMISSRLVAAALEAGGVPAVWIDPTEVVRTDARFGCAQPDFRATQKACRAVLVPVLESGRVPVLGGFLGATEQGIPTTLGRGGSDTTAAVLGACLDAAEIQIWTDVDGILTADPNLVPEAFTVDTVSFAEAAELAFCGARVLHPSSIAPAVERDIPVRVRNAGRPERSGTTVLRSAGERSARLASIASRPELAVLRVGSASMRHDPQRMSAVLECVRECGLDPVLSSASELGTMVIVPDSGPVADAGRALECFGQVQRDGGRAVVAVVGEGLSADASLRAAVLDAFARLSPEAVTTGASANGMVAVVPEAELESAVRALHARFFQRREAESCGVR